MATTLKLRPLDVGFDPKLTGHIVKIPADAGSAEIIDENGKDHLIQGDAEFIRKQLVGRGYKAEVELPIIQITRTGEPPLRFTGTKIGSGDTQIEGGNRANRWTEVNIYVTRGGKYIAHVGYRTCWQGEHGSDNARSFATPTELIGWLRSDNEGRLGRASQEACEDAAKNDDAFGKAFVEEVE